jgi:hypothetical protein
VSLRPTPEGVGFRSLRVRSEVINVDLARRYGRYVRANWTRA